MVLLILMALLVVLNLFTTYGSVSIHSKSGKLTNFLQSYVTLATNFFKTQEEQQEEDAEFNRQKRANDKARADLSDCMVLELLAK